MLQHPVPAEALGAAIAAATRAWAATVVLSPALGGIVIGQEVGRALGVRAIFAERTDGALALRRGFTLSPADRVLVVEDVLTTGGSTRETIDVAATHGATVVGAAAIIDRSGGRHGLPVPFAALCPMDLPTYPPDACPLCARRLPGRQARFAHVAEEPVAARARTLRLVVAYDGADFAGWQRQAGHRTVQGELEAVLAAIEGAPVHVAGAGRTDAGVHAAAQVASCRLTAAIAPDRLVRAFNATLPFDVRVLAADEMPDRFHARLHARGKTYRYFVWHGPMDHPALRRVAWHVPQRLSVAAMQEAAAAFVGEHDFAAFQGQGSLRDVDGAAGVRRDPRRRRRAARVVRARRRSRAGCCVSKSRAPASCATWCAPWQAPSCRWARAGWGPKTWPARWPAAADRRPGRRRRRTACTCGACTTRRAPGSCNVL